jgi:hypothetical protein
MTTKIFLIIFVFQFITEFTQTPINTKLFITEDLLKGFSYQKTDSILKHIYSAKLEFSTKYWKKPIIEFNNSLNNKYSWFTMPSLFTNQKKKTSIFPQNQKIAIISKGETKKKHYVIKILNI